MVAVDATSLGWCYRVTCFLLRRGHRSIEMEEVPLDGSSKISAAVGSIDEVLSHPPGALHATRARVVRDVFSLLSASYTWNGRVPLLQFSR